MQSIDAQRTHMDHNSEPRLSNHIFAAEELIRQGVAHSVGRDSDHRPVKISRAQFGAAPKAETLYGRASSLAEVAMLGRLLGQWAPSGMAGVQTFHRACSREVSYCGCAQARGRAQLVRKQSPCLRDRALG